MKEDQTNKPAMRHAAPALAASAAAALTAARANKLFYKAIYFNVAGSVNVVDAYGNDEMVTGGVGTVYPVSNCGAATGGTLSQGEFLCLYDSA